MVSIIMPTYNKCKYLELTLTGFLMQTYKNFEIIIIDDGSTDKTKQIVNSFMEKIKIVYVYQNNQGRPVACNKALELATGDYLIFCDDDRIPYKKFIEEHLKILERKDKVVTVGNKKEIMSILRITEMYSPAYLLELYKNNPHLSTKDCYREDLQLFSSHELENNFDTIVTRYARLEPADNFKIVYECYNENLNNFEFGWILGTTANLGVSRKVLKEARFDIKYNGWGMEDTDFLYRIYKKGYRFVLAKEAINYHQYHHKDSDDRMTLQSNMKYFDDKYNTLETALFVLLKKSKFSIIEINDIYHAIRRNPEDILAKTFVTIVHQILQNDSPIK